MDRIDELSRRRRGRSRRRSRRAQWRAVMQKIEIVDLRGRRSAGNGGGSLANTRRARVGRRNQSHVARQQARDRAVINIGRARPKGSRPPAEAPGLRHVARPSGRVEDCSVVGALGAGMFGVGTTEGWSSAECRAARAVRAPARMGAARGDDGRRGARREDWASRPEDRTEPAPTPARPAGA